MTQLIRTPALRVALVSVHGDPLATIGSEEAGGQNVYVRELARALTRRGHRVDVFTRHRQGRLPELLAMGDARVIRLPAGPVGFVERRRLFPYLGEFVRQIRDLGRVMGGGYHVLHTNYWLSGWVGMQLADHWGIAQVHTHHSLGAVKYAASGEVPEQGRQRLEIEQDLIASCHIVATTPQEVSLMRRHYGAARKMTIIPCGFDDEIFHPRDPRAARAELGLPEAAPLIVFVGRLNRQKGLETLLRALAGSRRSAELAIAGGWDPDTPDYLEYVRIRRLVRDLGLNERVHFLGKLTPERLALAYSAADLCAVPSHYESFGMVALESMACGTPVVASKVGGLQFTVVEGETGALVPPQDEIAWAQALERLLSAPEERRRLGEQGRRTALAEFTWSAVASRLERVYGDLRREAPRPRSVRA